MKLEKELGPGSDEIPGVPDLLKQHLLRKLRGPAVRVKVEAKTSATTHASLNAIRLAERGSAVTNPDIDGIAELVTKIIHAYHLEHESDDNYLASYRITCELRGDKSRPAERSFTVRYKPGEGDEDNELMRENDVLMQSLEMVRENNGSLTVQVADLHQVVLDFARSMNEPIRASSEMAQIGSQQWISGANMLLQANQQIYSLEAVRISEDAKTKRIEGILGTFGGTLTNLSAGLMEWGMKKLGVKLPGGGGKADAPKAERTAEPNTAAEQPAGDAEPAADPQPDPDQHRVLAVLVQAFHHTITPKQRKELNNGLTKKQLAALDDLFCAEDNDATADAWLAAYEALGLEKLLWMNGLLALEQQNDFNSIRTYIGKYIDKRKAERARKE